jgi:ribosomal protein L11 methyltransferase
MTSLPPHPATVVARLITDEATARRLSEIMAELLPADEVAVSAFELDETKGLWAVEFAFEHAPDEAALRALLQAQAGAEAAGALTFETLHAKDWVAASLEGLAPVSAGRFLVHGAHDRDRVGANRIDIEIEAALAFGTGHHGTTRGCLLAFDDVMKRRKANPTPPARSQVYAGCVNLPAMPATVPFQGRDNVLDIGTGTGVLAIAAARALRRRVLASDIDPVAVRVARENARRNRAGAYVSLFAAAGASAGRFRQSGKHGLIFANILVGPLKRMAAPIAGLLAPRGVVILSGLLPAHANTIIAAYRMQGLRLERRYRLDNWVTLVMRRSKS